MKRYYFTVTGMGIEKGVICFTCVHEFIKHLGSNRDIIGLNYSSERRQFTADCSLDSVSDVSAVIKESLVHTSLLLNKDFSLITVSEG